jgi:hypothetical protein
MLNRILSFLFLAFVLLTACTPKPAAQSNPEEAPYVLAARVALSEQLGVSMDQVLFVSAAAKDWTDSCLGLGGPAESCLAAITPGFEVTLTVDGTEYLVRTDTTGETARIP